MCREIESLSLSINSAGILKKNYKSLRDLPLIQLTDHVSNITYPNCQKDCLESVGDEHVMIVIFFLL